MKKLLFVSLFIIGFFGANAQSYWETDGNFYGGSSIDRLELGTKLSLFGTNNFYIIRAGGTMVMFENNITLAPSASTKVLIGDPQTLTTPGNYKLYVEEGIMTERVKVALSGTPDWADYVFKEGYELMPLAEVELFISKYGHLPNIPSAEELVEKGLDLGAMQAKQMAKIEELTLHLIQKDIEIKALQKENKKIQALQEQVELLSKQVELLLEKQ